MNASGGSPSPPGTRRGFSWSSGSAVLGLCTGLLAFNLLSRPAPLHDPGSAPRAVTPRGDLYLDELSTIELFESARRSVVYITNLRSGERFLYRNEFEIDGSGSGLIWDSRGYIVTNYHVVFEADSALVTLDDQSIWEARIVGYDEDKDLAVLKIEAPEERLHAVPLGESEGLRVGQKVFAIGNPFGLDHTLTTGIISGLEREIQSSFTDRRIYDLIQTDAAINPGNSGGPLLDSAGRLIGINTAIVSPSGVSVGVGFAVPVGTVNQVVPQIIRRGRPDRPGLGIHVLTSESNREISAAAGVRGIIVREVLPGSAAEQAGLQETRFLQDGRSIVTRGDLIQSIEGAAIEDVNDLLQTLGRHAVGDRILLGILRHSEEGPRRLDLTVTLQEVGQS